MYLRLSVNRTVPINLRSSIWEFEQFNILPKKLDPVIYPNSLISRLIAMVGRPLEHIPAPSSKTVGGREKVFGCNMSGATRVTLR